MDVYPDVPIMINGTSIQKLRMYNGFFISLSFGRRDHRWFSSRSQYPHGIFIEYPSNYRLSDLQSFIYDVRSFFSSGSLYHASSHYHSFYYESYKLCTPFFKALQMHIFPLLNTSDFLFVPFFSLGLFLCYIITRVFYSRWKCDFISTFCRC